MKIIDADFTWDGEGDFTHPPIYGLNLTLNRGELIAVVGEISSGKSLLASISGQVKLQRGVVKTNGAFCGFVPQEPWLINASLRDNILFGIDVNEEKSASINSAYNEAIRISGLTRDLLLLSNGDDTFVNELNLSRSQKQRISLARCIIHNPDIVLIEDCLSDFDQNNSRRLFKECIRNTLSRDKCVVMLTSQMHFLHDCDRILVLKGGKVIDEGTYDELKTRHSNFASWITDVEHVEDDPNGVFDKVNEIRLEPVSKVIERSKQISPLRPRNPENGPLSHLPLRRTPKNRSSPLASAKVINAKPVEVTQNERGGIELLIEQNQNSIQSTELNEHTLSKLIERNQGSILTGNTMRPPANFSNQDIVTRTIAANQLTVHSVHTFESGKVEPGILDDEHNWHLFTAVTQFLKQGPGYYAGIVIIFAFFIGAALRVMSGIIF